MFIILDLLFKHICQIQIAKLFANGLYILLIPLNIRAEMKQA